MTIHVNPVRLYSDIKIELCFFPNPTKRMCQIKLHLGPIQGKQSKCVEDVLECTLYVTFNISDSQRKPHRRPLSLLLLSVLSPLEQYDMPNDTELQSSLTTRLTATKNDACRLCKYSSNSTEGTAKTNCFDA